ncbi:raffinose/stachyose/melibiose transport system substrate-binding protein [Aequitasia blattaphilus]|uniref:ABC transporter substrate-binding protein n=1 Tax=Aequitasia blattaphilus TaxID=2949332 RepID=A0ABT1E8B4_9FIRM|nr:ABC transporter substrate-binding protein [Aequitasia blattaphilus]MCP1102076.1 ABC transporter substrate-binding protein [Aequitasia blattaphilus]MCR8614716.1 ABC transporter substrate-binding protein [Aequitasia blattaphilus]
MKKKIVSLLLVGSMMLGMLTGCGGSSKAKGNELELFLNKAENNAIMQTLVDEFNETQEEAKIKVVAPAEAETVLKTRMAKNDMPDLLAIGGNSMYTELQSAGLLEDLSDKEYLNTIQEAYMQMVYDINKEKEEKAYGVPYATNASGILYNVDKFEELGLEIPVTWDEFLKTMDQIKEAGEEPLLLTYKDAWTVLPSWNSMAPDLQPEGFTDDRKVGKTTFADTHQEIAEKYLTVLDYAQDDFMGMTYDDGNKAFANGRGVMMINGNWAINQFHNANQDFNVDMFAFPASNDEAKNYVTSGVDVLLAVSSTSKNKEVAEAFIEFMLKPENAQRYIDDQFAFSPIEGVEQQNVSVSSILEDLANEKVANFPDHYYPSGFDLASLLSEFSLNYVNGVDNKENVHTFLEQCDEKYDVANVD